MTISGMVGMTEASDLRKKVIDNRYMIHSVFSDIHHKQDTELLSELRLFLRKPAEYAPLPHYISPPGSSFTIAILYSKILLHYTYIFQSE